MKTNVTRAPAARKAEIPPKVQKALDAADAKTKRFILETIRLKQAGTFDALK